VTTALLLVAALGLGALFLALNPTYATAAFSLLFGSIVGISRAEVAATAVLASCCLLALGVLYRPLLFATVSPDSAAARGVPVRLVSVAFLVVVGMAAAVTVPVAGTLLIFALMVGPAAAAMHLTTRPATAQLLSVALACAAMWTGIVLAYETGWPIGFFIVVLVTVLYLGARLGAPTLRRNT
jgi:zinc/manganese transport system permease protein